MSCSVQLKTRNTVKSKKVNNVIHRTTSETIRLGEPEVIINNSSRQVMTALAISPPPLKKSTCSFQITGVSLTQRTDFAGDDSADDLDESHTDDISRVTDNETPSFSEDTCSRDADDNYIGSCSALCSVTVIPSSSQYGLAIVPSETSAVTSGNISESSANSLTSKASASTSAMSDITETQDSASKELQVTVVAPFLGTTATPTATQTPSTVELPVTTIAYIPATTASSTSPTTTASSTTPTTTASSTTPTTTASSTTPTTTVTVTTNSRFPGTRFEVVYVETFQPFRRGRWWCMDYLDDSIYKPKNALTYKSPDSPEISGTSPPPQYTMTATTPQVQPTLGSTDLGTNYPLTAPGVIQQSTIHPMTSQQGQVYNPQVPSYYPNVVRQSQSYSAPIPVPNQQLQRGPIDVMPPSGFIRQSSVPETHQAQVPSFLLQNSVPYAQALPVGGTIASTVQQLGYSTVAPQLQSAEVSRSLQQPSVVQQTMGLQRQQNQGQLISGDMYGVQSSQMYYGQAVPNQSVYAPQAPVYIPPPQISTSMQSYSNLVESGQNQPVLYRDQASGTSPQIMPGSVVQQSQTPLLQGQPTSIAATQQCNIGQTSQITTAFGDAYQVYSPGLAERRSNSSDSHSSGKTSHSSTRKSSLEPLVEDVSLVIATTAQDIVPASGAIASVPAASGLVSEGITAMSPPATYGNVANVSAVPPSASNASGVSDASTNVPTTVITPPIPDNSDAYNIQIKAANNTSAIIDSKIEQAMDLVKSHLMYTVREEVEVLKVRIAELLDRINQLERENSFLKANASPEVLNALNSRAPQDQPQGNVPSSTGADGGAPSK